MAFCTLLEWEEAFPFDRYEELNERSGGHDSLPDGCLARIVGAVESGAMVIEVWESDQHAKRFSDENSHLIGEVGMPPPSRVATFETNVFRASEA
jgi:hypothetical protein